MAKTYTKFISIYISKTMTTPQNSDKGILRSGSFTSAEMKVMLFQVTIAKIAPTVAVATISIVENVNSDKLKIWWKFALITS